LEHSGQSLDALGVGGLPDLGAFGIDIFFVISGFILSLTVIKSHTAPGRDAMWQFIKRRIIRIYPIYWFVALLTLFRLALSHQILRHNYVPAFFLLPSFHSAPSPAIFSYSWTLTFEMFFYLVLGLILLITTRRAVQVLVILLSISGCMGLLVNICHPIVILTCNPLLLEFVFGAVLAQMYVRYGHRRWIGRGLTIAGAVSALYLGKQHSLSIAYGPAMIFGNIGVFARVATWGLCAAVVVAGAILWSPSMKSASGRWFVRVGNSSYSAYLVSAIVLEYASRLYLKLTMPTHTFMSRFLFQATMIVAVLGLGFACYVVIEKPMLNYLQARFLRKPRARHRVSDTLTTPA
jgi:exopolysaccharide production protein ExoZ